MNDPGPLKPAPDLAASTFVGIQYILSRQMAIEYGRLGEVEFDIKNLLRREDMPGA